MTQGIELQLLKVDEFRVYKVQGCRLGINNRNFLLPDGSSQFRKDNQVKNLVYTSVVGKVYTTREMKL